MKKSGANDGTGGDSASWLIDARIKELGDWRGETGLPRLDPSRELWEFRRVSSKEGHAMKKTYEKPVLVRRALLSKVTAFPPQSQTITS